MQTAVMEVPPEPRPILYQPVKITSELVHTRTDDFHKINQYTKLGRIGKGKHGQVYLCRDNDGQEWVSYTTGIPCLISEPLTGHETD